MIVKFSGNNGNWWEISFNKYLMLKGLLLFTELPEMDFKVKALGRDVQIKKGLLFYIIQRAKLKRYKG